MKKYKYLIWIFVFLVSLNIIYANHEIRHTFDSSDNLTLHANDEINNGMLHMKAGANTFNAGPGRWILNWTRELTLPNNGNCRNMTLNFQENVSVGADSFEMFYSDNNATTAPSSNPYDSRGGALPGFKFFDGANNDAQTPKGGHFNNITIFFNCTDDQQRQSYNFYVNSTLIVNHSNRKAATFPDFLIFARELDVSMWMDNLSVCNATSTGKVDFGCVSHGAPSAPPPPASPANITLKANDYYDAVAINNFSARIYNGSIDFIQTTNNGTILITNITESLFYNITFFSNQSYFNITSRVNVSQQTYTERMWQSLIYVNATEIISGISIINFWATANKSVVNESNSSGIATLRVRAGSYNITINATPYFNASISTNVTTLNSANTTLELGKIKLTINATVTTSKEAIFNMTNRLNKTNSPYQNYTNNQSTSSGTIIYYLINGTYQINFEADNYANAFTTLNLNETNNLPNYTFSVYTTNSINFTLLDEVIGKNNLLFLNGTEVKIEFSSSVFSANYSSFNATLYVDLIQPSDYRITYSSGNYRSRNYYFTLKNRSNNVIDLYLLSIGNGTFTKFTINDQNSNPFENVTLKAQRYYVLSNTYEIIAMAKTDAQGQAQFDLQQNNAFYKFLITSPSGAILQDTIPSTVFATAYTLRVTTETNSYLNIRNRNLVFTNLTFSNNSNSYSFTYNNLQGLGVNTCLKSYELSFSNGEIEICNTCSTSSSATLICNINNSYSINKTTIARAYTYEVSGSNSTAILLDELIITPRMIIQETKEIFGTFGLFMGFIIFMTMTLIGLWNPIVALVLGTFGFVVSYLLGLITLGVSSISWLIGISLLVGIIAYRSRA